MLEFEHVFIDANILIDIFDQFRTHHIASKQALEYCLAHDKILFTSCDLISTIYYISAKQNPKIALQQIQAINTLCEVIAFSNKEIEQTCLLMLEDESYQDLEDTIQYILAKKQQCELILSNNKDFVSDDIELMTARNFCLECGIYTH